MENCYQSAHETVWQHCQSVAKTYFDLLEDPSKFPLPPIILNNFEHIRKHQLPSNIVREYLEWHDCGKPACLTEIDGRYSFPNHAEVSERLFREAGGNETSARLIGLDMVFHVTKPAEILERTASLDIPTTMTLMLSAWAAIFANAEMFGGRDSESFKIKHSQLTSRCKKVLSR